MSDDPLELSRTAAFVADVRTAVAVLDSAGFTPDGNTAWGNARSWIIANAERIARALAAEQSGDEPSSVPVCAGRSAVAHAPVPMKGAWICPVCDEIVDG